MRGNVKPLLRSDEGLTFVTHAVPELLASDISELILVTGASHHLVEEELVKAEFAAQGPRFRTSHNPNYREGMLGSIQVGIQAANPRSDAFLICLVDQPFLNRRHYNEILRAHREDAGLHGLFRLAWHGRMGNPALLSARYREEVLAAKAMDRGCSFLFENHEDDVRLVEVDDNAILVDIDSPMDYEKFILKASMKSDDGIL